MVIRNMQLGDIQRHVNNEISRQRIGEDDGGGGGGGTWGSIVGTLSNQTDLQTALDTATQGPAGPQGPAGNDGATGPQGDQGPSGADGNTVLSGVGAPAGGLGFDGDFYVDTSANEIYGPKSGTWGSGTALIGPAGANGATGPAGPTGPAGNDGAQGPQGIQGIQGDTGATGATGSQGPQGDTGATGPQGPAGQGIPVGGSAGQVLEKIDGADYNTQWVTPSVGGGGGVDAKPGAFELSTSHNITTTESTIPFDTEVFDPDTNYINTAGEITVADGGYYHVSINVPINDDGTAGATRGRVFGFLQKDAATGTWTTVNHIRGQVYEREASGGTGFAAAGIVSLVAGEAIRFIVDVSSSVDVSTEAGEASLSIFRIR